jgi:hypothetical protein
VARAVLYEAPTTNPYYTKPLTRKSDADLVDGTILVISLPEPIHDHIMFRQGALFSNRSDIVLGLKIASLCYNPLS